MSAVAGTGLDELRRVLDQMVESLPPPDPTARVRLWIDRSFSISGAGTVVTGTLAAGTLTRGDRLQMYGPHDLRTVSVRALHSRNQAVPSVGPTSRVAVNLRSGVPADAVHRGDVLLSEDRWPVVDTIDVRRTMGTPFGDVPRELVAHIGTAAVPCRLRSFDGDHARLAFDRQLPLELGDRLVLRTTDSRSVLAGVQILDVDPPGLKRRGDSAQRAQSLAVMPPDGDALIEVARRGAVRMSHLRRMGVASLEKVPGQVRAFGDWWVHEPVFEAWQRRLRLSVQERAKKDPLSAGLSRGAARELLGPEGAALLDAVVREAGLEHDGGFIRLPGVRSDLGPAEAAVRAVERGLESRPFAAPEAHDLKDLGLGDREASPQPAAADGCCGWRAAWSCFPKHRRWRCVNWPACRSPSRPVRPANVWTPPDVLLSRCWNTSMSWGGPGASTPATAPSSVRLRNSTLAASRRCRKRVRFS